jgi:glycosyl transferase family 25
VASQALLTFEDSDVSNFCSNSTMHSFMRIRVVSPKSAHARRRHMQREMAASGLRFEFFDAIDASTAIRSAPQVSKAWYLATARRMPTAGELGCYLSHRAVWQQCVACDEAFVVLEDDCHLEHGFARALATIEWLVKEHGFVRLENAVRPSRRLSLHPHPPLQELYERDGLSLAYVADVPTGLVGYALSPSAAARLVAASLPIRAPVDRYVQRVLEHGVPVFAVTPPIVGRGDASLGSIIGERTRTRNAVISALRFANSLWGQVRRREFNRRQLQELCDRGRSIGNP